MGRGTTSVLFQRRGAPVEHGPHVQSLCPRHSGPGVQRRPVALCCMSSPLSLSSHFLPSLSAVPSNKSMKKQHKREEYGFSGASIALELCLRPTVGQRFNIYSPFSSVLGFQCLTQNTALTTTCNFVCVDCEMQSSVVLSPGLTQQQKEVLKICPAMGD